MPGALGVQLALPNRPVVAILGDGASMYTFQALWTAAHYDLPVKYILCNNRSYEILKANMTDYLGEATEPSHFLEMDLTDPTIDFASLSRACGVKATTVQRLDQLNDALRVAFAAPGPHLVDVILSGLHRHYAAA